MCRLPIVVVAITLVGTLHAADPAQAEKPDDIRVDTVRGESEPFSVEHPKIGPLLRSKISDGAATPRELIERLYAGLKKGDGPKVASCFDRSTEDGRIAAAGFAILAEMDAAAFALEAAASKKFGERGATIIRDNTGVHTADALSEAHAFHSADPKTLPILGDEKAGRLIVRLPIRQIRPPSLLSEAGPALRLIERRVDRWYLIEPTASRLPKRGKALLQSQLELWSDRAEAFRQRLDDIEKSQTVEELCEMFLFCELPPQ
jgi:hypothetical protein